MESSVALFVLLSVVIGIPAAFWIAGVRKTKREKFLRTKPFPDTWSEIITRRFPLYGKLPKNLREELNGDINIFLDEKTFEGCDGFEITDEVRLVIAAQACTLLLNRTNYVYPKLHGVLVYPSTYIHSQTVLSESLRTEGDVPVAGLSYSSGLVSLAWSHVIGGAMNSDDGKNVVFHEFAHQLDNESGTTDGFPRLVSSDARKWIEVVDNEFQEFIKKIATRHKDVIDEYGGTNPAEFFAVTTETFFEKPFQLRHQHEELFEMFMDFYRLDPRDWK